MKWPFGTKPKEPYTVVEMKVDSDHFRQGIRLNLPEKYSGIVITTSARVSLTVVDEQLVVGFDYVVHKNPNNIELKDSELRPLIGAAVIDLINKDHNAFGISDS